MSDLDAEGCLLTEAGKKIPRLALSAPMFIDKTIIIYGPSGTGKTVIAKTVMNLVKDHIEQVLTVSPNELTNRSYDGVVDPPLLYLRAYLPDPANPKKDDGTKGTIRFLEAVWARQMMMRAVYERANNADVLSRLFGRLPRDVRRDGVRVIDRLNKKRSHVVARVRQQFADDTGRRDEKVKEVNEKFKKMLVLIYKKYITPYYSELFAIEALSEDELYSLTYLQFNPRLLFVLDDCAADLKPMFNKEIFRKLFYQGRHASITTILMAQDDTDVPANLRKNAFVSIFTDPIACTSNFERQTNKFSKDTKRYVAELLADVFVGNRKLAYIREDPRRQHFYHVEVPYPKPFRFGSEALHELCDSVRNSGVTMDKENPYYEKFKIAR